MTPWARFRDRRRARRRLRKDVAIWFHADYEPAALRFSGRVPGLHPDRAELALKELANDGLLSAPDIRIPEPAGFGDLALVHDPDYLAASTTADKLAHIFALDPELVEVDTLVRAARRAVGGTIAAAELVASGERRIAVNMGGGFHHAEPGAGSGFCVYNDVAVAIRRLRARGFGGRIAIIDLDFHHGNGNTVAFAGDPSVLTYSIHGMAWTHVPAVADIPIVLPLGCGDAVYLEKLRTTLPEALRAHAPELVFYLAGADVLEGDPLGDFGLSTRALLERDRFVIESAGPVVITLAGGYREDVWRVSAAMLRWLLTGRASLSEERTDDLRARFSRVARRLDPFELQREEQDGWRLEESDVLGHLRGNQATRLLDYYSAHGVELALERYGLLPKLRARGFTDVRVELDPSDRQHQRLRVFGRRTKAEPVLLVELVVRRQSVAPPGADVRFEMLTIEWLLLQDPTSSFSPARPRLPGQEHPGLGMSKDVMELLYQAALRLGLDGLLVRPAHFHVAVVNEGFRFLDPRLDGRFRALRHALSDVSVADASFKLGRNELSWSDGAPIVWEPGDLVLPVSDALRQWLYDDAWTHEQAAAYREASTRLDPVRLGAV
jgi:acetoin utilization deacetylase AcuC-like enzyme